MLRRYQVRGNCVIIAELLEVVVVNKLQIAALALASFMSFAVAGCALAPTAGSGPTTASVITGIAGEPEALPYSLIHLTPEKLEVLAHSRSRFSRAFSSRDRKSVV